MAENQPRRFRWFRFTLGQLFVLTTGIAIGFAPLKPWELFEPPSRQVLIHVRHYEIPHDQLAALGMPAGELKTGIIRLNDLDPNLESKLRSLGTVRLMSEHTNATISGQPLSMFMGTEIHSREVGVRVTLLPIVMRNGRVRMKVTTTYSVWGRTPDRWSSSTEFEAAEHETIVLSQSRLNQKDSSDPQSPPRNETLLILATIERAKSR